MEVGSLLELIVKRPFFAWGTVFDSNKVNRADLKNSFCVLLQNSQHGYNGYIKVFVDGEAMLTVKNIWKVVK